MTDSILQFTAPIELTAAADKPVKISIRAYAGGEMNIAGYGPVVVDISGLDISRPVPLLAEHQSDIAGLLGTGQASTNGRELNVVGVLSRASDLTEKIVAMHRDGVQFSASIGAQPLEREIIAEGKNISVNNQTIKAGRGGLTLIRRAVLRETSIVAVAADADSSVAIAASLQGTKNMTDNEFVMTPEKTALLEANFHSGLPDPEVEKRRMQLIECWAPRLGDSAPAELQAKAADLHAKAVAGEISLDQLRLGGLEIIRAARPKAPPIYGSSSDVSGPDVLQAALLCHLGAEDVSARCFGDQVTQTARDARMTSLVEILQASFRSNGEEAPRDRNSLIKAAFSTASIAAIVSNAQNKILLDQWARLPMTWPSLCRQVSASNFKEGKAIRLGGRDAMMDEIGAAGEIKHGSLDDSAATFQIDTYAKMYALTRQHIVNDDLGALDELPKVIARGAALKMESVLWTLILANTGDFFGEDNGNLLGDELDIDGLGAAVAVMRALVDADGEPVLVEPRTLVVPPALEAKADALYASTNVVVSGGGDTVTTAPSASPFAGKYKPLCSPYISNAKYTGYSTTQWYLFADPNSGPAAFLAAFLNGMTNPTIEQSDTDFNTLGVQYRGFLDFGFAQCDSQGAVKSTGAGE
ncbi:MAG: hypothetical protein GX594_13365 [Pirellulaceae bacterium]|nr:hypothetical protein [Pirellulaceae bacterium]